MRKQAEASNRQLLGQVAAAKASVSAAAARGRVVDGELMLGKHRWRIGIHKKPMDPWGLGTTGNLANLGTNFGD